MQSLSNKQASTEEIIPNSDQMIAIYSEHIRSAQSLYNWLIELGVCREQARMILPQCMYTEFYGTVDLLNLLKFLKLRLASDAQWEFRQYANAIVELIRPIVPNVVENFLGEYDEKISAGQKKNVDKNEEKPKGLS